MLKTPLLLLFLWFLLPACQSGTDKLKSSLQDSIIYHIQAESFKHNGAVHLDTCVVLSVDTLNDRQFDSVMLATIRTHRDYYDSMADDFLKRGNDFNHEAFTFQKAGDTAKFNLAVLNATDSHYQAGNFIDSSMAIQRTAEFLRNKTAIDSTNTGYYSAKVFLKATFFTPTDSTKVRDTLYYHFAKNKRIIDVNREIDKLVRYDF